MKNRRSLRSIGIGIAIAATAAVGSLAVSAPASAATDLSTLRIIEGQGLGNLITLGQTRSQVANVVNTHNPGSNTCQSTPVGSKCYFALGEGYGRVGVVFGNDQRVNEVIIHQFIASRENQWPTSVGNIDGKTVQQVQSLYPGSTITGYGVRAQLHTDGYRYETLARCYQSCTILSSHYIIPGSNNGGGGGGGGGVENPTFTGTIDVTPSVRGQAQLRISIIDPNGNVTGANVNRRLQRNRTISLNPADFVSVDGPQGTYTYHVEVVKTNRRGRERVVATGVGAFNLG